VDPRPINHNIKFENSLDMGKNGSEDQVDLEEDLNVSDEYEDNPEVNSARHVVDHTFKASIVT
jgi:hypothetical protein